ncbi:MAG TPA: hypothetical protein VF145_00620 [Chitinophagaceae bacterium]
MAKRYFNIFRNHLAVIVALIVLICTGELAEGTTATLAKIATGVLMIYVAISYALWLLRAPVNKVNEENL